MGIHLPFCLVGSIWATGFLSAPHAQLQFAELVVYSTNIKLVTCFHSLNSETGGVSLSTYHLEGDLDSRKTMGPVSWEQELVQDRWAMLEITAIARLGSFLFKHIWVGPFLCWYPFQGWCQREGAAIFLHAPFLPATSCQVFAWGLSQAYLVTASSLRKLQFEYTMPYDYSTLGRELRKSLHVIGD